MVDDAPAMDALRCAQIAREKWHARQLPAVAASWLVREVGDFISGAIAYSVGTDAFFVLELWVADGLCGYRAAVELCYHVEALARELNLPVHFEVAMENEAFQNAVEAAGYEPISLHYRLGG